MKVFKGTLAYLKDTRYLKPSVIVHTIRETHARVRERSGTSCCCISVYWDGCARLPPSKALRPAFFPIFFVFAEACGMLSNPRHIFRPQCLSASPKTM